MRPLGARGGHTLGVTYVDAVEDAEGMPLSGGNTNPEVRRIGVTRYGGRRVRSRIAGPP